MFSPWHSAFNGHMFLVAFFLAYCFTFIVDGFVVVGNDCFSVFVVVIAKFDVISLENTGKFMIFWEVLT